MQHFSVRLAGATLALIAPCTHALDLAAWQTQDAAPTWKVGTTLAEESVGQGLPVLALSRGDWPRYGVDTTQPGHAWRSIRADVYAIHPNGWRVGAVLRAEAWVQGNADAVALATAITLQQDPASARSYVADTSAQGWVGRGFQIGTPWWNLPATEAWQWQADAALLQLTQLRRDEIKGMAQYQNGGTYAFDAHRTRSNPDNDNPFLTAPGTTGQGATMSLALRGQPAAHWRVQLRADDLLSRLRWSGMPTETSSLNSNVTTRAADGSLDYGPAIQGQVGLRALNTTIGAHWQAQAAWNAFADTSNPGAITLRADRKAGITQGWLGWDSGGSGRWRWAVAAEPVLHAASLDLWWGGLQISLATDAKGLQSHYRRWRLGWEIPL